MFIYIYWTVYELWGKKKTFIELSYPNKIRPNPILGVPIQPLGFGE